MLEFPCPHCGRTLKNVPSGLSGAVVPCPYCAQSIRIVGDDEVAGATYGPLQRERPISRPAPIEVPILDVDVLEEVSPPAVAEELEELDTEALGTLERRKRSRNRFALLTGIAGAGLPILVVILMVCGWFYDYRGGSGPVWGLVIWSGLGVVGALAWERAGRSAGGRSTDLERRGSVSEFFARFASRGYVAVSVICAIFIFAVPISIRADRARDELARKKDAADARAAKPVAGDPSATATPLAKASATGPAEPKPPANETITIRVKAGESAVIDLRPHFPQLRRNEPKPEAEIKIVASPEGISDDEWQRMLRTHATEGIVRIELLNLPTDPTFRPRIITELVRNRPWNKIFDRGEMGMQVIIPGRDSEVAQWRELGSSINFNSWTRTLYLKVDQKKALAAIERREESDRQLSRDDEFEARIAAACKFPEHAVLIKEYRKTYPLKKLVLIEITDTGLTDEQRNLVGETLSQERTYRTMRWDLARKCGEAFFAPIEEFEAFGKKFSQFELTGLSPSEQRITLRPRAAELQGVVDFRRDMREIDDLSTLVGGSRQMLDNVRFSTGVEHVSIVNVKNPGKGIGKDPLAIYRKIKAIGPLLKIIRLGNDERQYVVKYDDFVEFVGKLDFGTVVNVDGKERLVTLDLETTKAKPVEMKSLDTEKYVVYDTPERYEFDLLEMRKKFGRERVLQMRGDDMPDDPVQREFVRKFLCDNRETVRVYIDGKKEHYLLAPVDNDNDYQRRTAGIGRGGSAWNYEHKYSILVDPAGVRRAMEKTAQKKK